MMYRHHDYDPGHAPLFEYIVIALALVAAMVLT